MPRRNRNANPAPINGDTLADHARALAAELTTSGQINAAPGWVSSWQVEVIPLPDPARCAGCGTNPATCGDYCALCKGTITVSARRASLGRR